MTGYASQHVGQSLPAWDGASYAANTGHHRATDAAFLDTLPFGPTDRVLDIGCGSGDFTRKVADLIPDGWVVGIDPSESLLDTARAAAGPNQEFQLLRAQQLGALNPSRPFDVVLSRAALHWVRRQDHPGVLAAAHQQLRPGGLLRLEFGGAGNVPAITGWLNELAPQYGGPQDPWHFPAAGDYLELVLDAGFDVTEGWVRQVAQRRPFSRETVLGWLTSQTLQAYDHPMTPENADAFRRHVVRDVDQLQRGDGSYDLTFVRLDVRARK